MTLGADLWKISTGARAVFQRSRQLPLNPWVGCRSRTFSSGEIVDRIRADGGRPGELMRIVNSALRVCLRISSIQMP
jgi:hypothetical protein